MTRSSPSSPRSSRAASPKRRRQSRNERCWHEANTSARARRRLSAVHEGPSPGGRDRRDDDAVGLPAPHRVLPAQDGARAADPPSGRRGGEAVRARRPGRADGRGRAPVRRARAPGRAHEAAHDRLPVLHLEPRRLHGAGEADVPIGLPFFLWVGVFSYTVVAQFWALAADIYTDEQGKRLFPIIGAGSSIGAVVGRPVREIAGAVRPARADGGRRRHPARVRRADRRDRAARAVRAVKHERRTARRAARRARARWHLLARDRYLWFIAGMAIFLNWVNSSGEYLLDRTLLVAAKDAAAARRAAVAQPFIGALKADYFVWYNAHRRRACSCSRSRASWQVVGVRARALLPALASRSSPTDRRSSSPCLAVMRLVKIGENSLQYSLQDTTRHALFLVTSRVEKFVGKTAVDTIAVRIGAIMSGAHRLHRHAGSAGRSSTFAALNVGLAAVWIGFVVLIGKSTAAAAPNAPAPPGSNRPCPRARKPSAPTA